MRRLLWTLALSAVLASRLPGQSIDGAKIHWASAGMGEATLVFVHGWTCDSTSWSAQVVALAKKYRVITLDLPGHGQSGSPADGRFSMDVFARAVEAVREAAKTGKVVLVGHSMGAPVIRTYARLYPQHVAALVAVDGPLDMRGGGPQPDRPAPPMTGPEGLKMREDMISWMFTPQTPVALREQIRTMMLRTPEATAVGALAAVFDPANRTDDVVPMPVLAIYAGTAQLPTVEELEKTKKSLPNFEAIQISGTGHFVMMEKPEEFNEVLTAFVDRITF